MKKCRAPTTAIMKMTSRVIQSRLN